MSELAILAVVPAECLGSRKLPPDARTIALGGFAAVLSKPPKEGIRGRPRSELAPWLLTGQRIVESVMDFAPVLPVTFGTVATNDGIVRGFLTEGQPLFKQAFAVLGDQIEMDVSVRWDMHQVVREIAMDGDLTSRLATAGTDGEKQAAGQELAGLVQQRRDCFGNHILNAVSPLASDVIPTVPPEPEAVVNVALLLDRNAIGGLEGVLDTLDGFFSGRLSFRMVGPMAPYSFATIHVHFPQPDEVNRARAVLDVAGFASAEEIKTAYRSAVRRIHPDLTSAKGEVAEMVALVDAYETLRDNRISVSLRRNGAT